MSWRLCLPKRQVELDTAEADAVGHVGSATNGRSYRYATLASVWLAIRKPLTAHGLAVTQTCESSKRGELRLTTTLLHQSGQQISGTEIVPMSVQTPQGLRLGVDLRSTLRLGRDCRRMR